ncbi:MAG TPA: trimethylamine corrinoid protein 2 [Clostridiales bacterium]|nr:trimethylamine corrinoid protein 2 [Clostridiales bacterium]
MQFKPDIDKVRERLYAFWERELIDRACIAVVAPREKGAHISMFHNDRDLTNDPEALRCYWEDPETILNNAISRMERTFFGGDALPMVFQNYGTSGHCRYFGAKPLYGNDTIWFDPVWQSLEDVHNSYTEEALKMELEIAKYLTEHAQGRYFVAMPDNCGTLDAIGHLYGTENVLMDMLTAPEQLKEASRILNEAWIKTSEMFYRISESLNGGGAHAWMHLLAPGRLNHMQCDMSVMFSPHMFEQFVLPELEQQMEWLEYPVYHFDGIEQERHLSMILSLPKLKAIQWTYVAGQPAPSKYLSILKKIQKAGKSLIIMAPPGDIPALLDNLSAKGLYLNTETQTPEEADDIVRYVEKHSKENPV